MADIHSQAPGSILMAFKRPDLESWLENGTLSFMSHGGDGKWSAKVTTLPTASNTDRSFMRTCSRSNGAAKDGVLTASFEITGTGLGPVGVTADKLKDYVVGLYKGNGSLDPTDPKRLEDMYMELKSTSTVPVTEYGTSRETARVVRAHGQKLTVPGETVKLTFNFQPCHLAERTPTETKAQDAADEMMKSMEAWLETTHGLPGGNDPSQAPDWA